MRPATSERRQFERSLWSGSPTTVNGSSTNCCGGEHQHVGIARALAGEPRIVIADEPTAELDPDNRENVLSLLLERASQQRIVIVASDDPEVVARFPRVVELEAGRVRAIGPPQV